MNYKLRNLIEELVQVAVVVVFVTIFAGLFGLIGYELGQIVREGDSFIKACNCIQDTHQQH
jgi:hypothetical protein